MFWTVAQNTAVSVLCSVQNKETIMQNEVNAIDERNFSRFEFKMSFGRMSYIAATSKNLLRKWMAAMSYKRPGIRYG